MALPSTTEYHTSVGLQKRFISALHNHMTLPEFMDADLLRTINANISPWSLFYSLTRWYETVINHEYRHIAATKIKSYENKDQSRSRIKVNESGDHTCQLLNPIIQ